MCHQGSAKLEKAEILQMTVDHLKVLQATGGKGTTTLPRLTTKQTKMAAEVALPPLYRKMKLKHLQSQVCFNADQRAKVRFGVLPNEKQAATRGQSHGLAFINRLVRVMDSG